MVIAELQKNVSPLFYITIASAIILIGLIIFFIIKLKHNFKQISKAFGISALITLAVEFLMWLFISFTLVQNFCKTGAVCPSPLLEGFYLALYFFIPIFIIVLFFYYLIAFFRRK